MTRRIQITGINPANRQITLQTAHPDNPSNDWTPVFQGRFYRDPAAPANLEKPATWGPYRQWEYEGPAPSGWKLISATSFSLIENGDFDGRYTVYTPTNNLEWSSEFSGGFTTVRVEQPLTTLNPTPNTTTGAITNISTYYILTPVAGFNGYFIVPSESTVNVGGYDFIGYRSFGWGEVIQQNYHNALFAYRFRHDQISGSTTWMVAHNLNVPFPHVVMTSFFWDDAGTIRPIFPASITFDSANQLTATFSAAISGYVLVRT